MRALVGFIIAVLIFIGLPTLAFFALFQDGVATIDFVMNEGGLRSNAFVRLLAKAIYGLAFWVLFWGLGGFCAKRFVEFWERPKT